MKVIISNNGTEYTSEKFNKFCEKEGIEHQLTAPYTPQQNGVVERKNRTLMEMTRCVATQFLTHVLINFQKNPKIAKKTLKIQKIHF